ncbi:MAG: hypothetical protein AMXMBFR13_32510 [Phycisphaerae bacterium]
MRRAFTLIELLVAVSIVALLAAILLPSLARARGEGRRAVCLSNLRQLSIAACGYLDEHRDHFWPYFTDVRAPERGRRWWFGFEPNGPRFAEPNRPLDKRQAVLARYLRSTDDALQCPEFPYTDGLYFPKFAARSASYGYNLLLGPSNPWLPTSRRGEFHRRSATVFVFADGIHFDFNPGLNEGHYIEYIKDPAAPGTAGGFGHFRHNGRAQVLFMDGHAEAQVLRGAAYGGRTAAGSAGNLTDAAGGFSIYGGRN